MIGSKAISGRNGCKERKKHSSLADRPGESKAQGSGRVLLVWTPTAWSMVEGQEMGWHVSEESLEWQSDSFTVSEERALGCDCNKNPAIKLKTK